MQRFLVIFDILVCVARAGNKFLLFDRMDGIPIVETQVCTRRQSQPAIATLVHLHYVKAEVSSVS